MDINKYIRDLKNAAFLQGFEEEQINQMTGYAIRLLKSNLPVVFDQEHFSLLVGYDYQYILALSNSVEYHYKHFEIPKKNGGNRSIDEPYPSLKEIQTWILRNILTPASKSFVSPVAKAFMPGKSLRDNARFHKNKKRVIALDIHDFFGSIHFGAVYGLFKRMGYSKSVSTLLTKVCMYQGSLPQGAPTSPMLSNLVFKPIDDAIYAYCQARKILYTRYADDMVFSSDDMNSHHLIAYVTMRVNLFRMEINEEKTKVMGKGMRQNVTGVVVNEKLQVSRSYRKRVRQEMFYAHKYGIANHFHRVKDIPAWIKTPVHYAHHLYGKICFILQINPRDEEFKMYKSWLGEQIKAMNN